MKFNKKMVIGVAAFVALFTVAVLWLSYLEKPVQPELIEGVYSLCGAEGVLLALLRKFCD